MSTKAWLPDRFQSKRADAHRERWKSILSLLAPLMGVDESTSGQSYGSQSRHEVAAEIAQHHRNQPFAGSGEQGESRGGSSTDTVEAVIRRDVGALRKTRHSGQVMTMGECDLAAIA